MLMANIACVRSIVTDRRSGARQPGKPVRLTLALVALMAAPALLRAEAAPKPDPSFPFSREIEAFAKANDAGPALTGATLFIGSSSIRLWDISGSFPNIATVNRGFGGATTPDVLHHYARLLPRARPASVVVYVGENDLTAGRTPAQVAGDILTLLRRLRSDYPRARIAFLSLKPSPIRWTLWPKMAAVNMTVAARGRVVGFDYIDVGRVLLAPDGLPDASLFRADGLHMNPSGYARWTRIVDDYLDRSPVGNAAARAS
ncbi:MAG: GDSL-type esterase/lipase family protein [Sphingobium sp.]